MAIGANLSIGNKQTLARIFKSLGNKKSGPLGDCRLSFKDGAPVDNTAADSPGEVGMLIYDFTNDDTYVCTAFTNATTFTVVKITP